jgi:hypothetical protein
MIMADKTEFRVYLPHKVGQLALMCDGMYQAGVNIRTVAGIAVDSPLIALVVDEEDKARSVLHELNLKFEEHELLSISLFNMPGEIANLTRLLAGAGVNIESIYLSTETGEEKGEISFTVDDSDKAREALGI